MTKHGESDGFKASDFIREVQEYLGSLARLDYTIVNSTPFPEKALNRYSLEKAFPVEVDAAECEKLVSHVVEAPLLSPGSLLRHDPHRLAQTIIGILQGRQECRLAPKVLVAVNPPSLS